MERISYDQYKQAIEVILKYSEQNKERFLISEYNKSDKINPNTLFVDSGASIRLYNRISRHFREKGLIPYNTTYLDVSKLSYSDIKKIGGIGAASIKELDEILSYAGLNIKS
jgi:hypothetical protein